MIPLRATWREAPGGILEERVVVLRYRLRRFDAQVALVIDSDRRLFWSNEIAAATIRVAGSLANDPEAVTRWLEDGEA